MMYGNHYHAGKLNTLNYNISNEKNRLETSQQNLMQDNLKECMFNFYGHCTSIPVIMCDDTIMIFFYSSKGIPSQ
jgi:hypothetical protein